MAHLVGRAHCVDKDTLAKVNTAIVFGLISSGLAVCVVGAAVFDIGRLFSAW